jgi:GTP cyclohydrolase I
MENTIKELLLNIGEDPTREGLVETPRRTAKAWEFWTSGYKQDPQSVMKTFALENNDQMIVVKNIDFYSHCEHHMAPFYGQVHVGYIPDGRVLGVSKFARLVEIYSRRLQIQERMTKQIADAIMEYLKPQGVGVIVEGIHLCMRSRGVEKQNSTMITSVMLGNFRENSETRQEFMKLLSK